MKFGVFSNVYFGANRSERSKQENSIDNREIFITVVKKP